MSKIARICNIVFDETAAIPIFEENRKAFKVSNSLGDQKFLQTREPLSIRSSNANITSINANSISNRFFIQISSALSSTTLQNSASIRNETKNLTESVSPETETTIDCDVKTENEHYDPNECDMVSVPELNYASRVQKSSCNKINVVTPRKAGAVNAFNEATSSGYKIKDLKDDSKSSKSEVFVSSSRVSTRDVFSKQSANHSNCSTSTTGDFISSLKQKYPSSSNIINPNVVIRGRTLPEITTKSQNLVNSRSATVLGQTSKKTQTSQTSIATNSSLNSSQQAEKVSPLMALLRKELADKFQSALVLKERERRQSKTSEREKKIQSENSNQVEKMSEIEKLTSENRSNKELLKRTNEKLGNPLPERSKEITLNNDENSEIAKSDNKSSNDVSNQLRVLKREKVVAKQPIVRPEDIVTTIHVTSQQKLDALIAKSESFNGNSPQINYNVIINVQNDVKDSNKVSDLKPIEGVKCNDMPAQTTDSKPDIDIRKSELTKSQTIPPGILRSPTNFDMKLATKRSVSFALDLEHIRLMSPAPRQHTNLRKQMSVEGKPAKKTTRKPRPKLKKQASEPPNIDDSKIETPAVEA
ncbi:uncharacterized protein LOC142354737 isoform X2 [Convolutriloba macropyga]|uniref:uncharacterized protein LOC142354737 isoform X2 n=1 Tax=Convolutriloba macropyga TaxID=536237 RepID=UPI003F5269BB